MPEGIDELVRRYRHHEPQPGQPERYQKIRAGVTDLALLIDDISPDSREKTLALDHLDSVMFFANAAIARRG